MDCSAQLLIGFTLLPLLWLDPGHHFGAVAGLLLAHAFASSYALCMDLSRAPLVATQFSAFMAATNGCEAWSSAVGGQIVSAHGYTITFVIMAGVSLLSVPLVSLCEKSGPQQRALELTRGSK